MSLSPFPSISVYSDDMLSPQKYPHRGQSSSPLDTISNYRPASPKGHRSKDLSRREEKSAVRGAQRSSSSGSREHRYDVLYQKYKAVKEENLTFRVRNEELRSTNQELLQQIIALKAAAQNTHSPISPTTLLSADNSSSSANTVLLNPFPVPQRLPKDRQNFPQVKFWSRRDFSLWEKSQPKDDTITAEGSKKKSRKTLLQDNTNVAAKFMCLENGVIVDGDTVTAMRANFRQSFDSIRLLPEHYRTSNPSLTLPSSWGNISPTLRNYVLNEFYGEFPYAEYCDGHWKANVLAGTTLTTYNNTHDKSTDSTKKRVRIKTEAPTDVVQVESNTNATPSNPPTSIISTSTSTFTSLSATTCVEPSAPAAPPVPPKRKTPGDGDGEAQPPAKRHQTDAAHSDVGSPDDATFLMVLDPQLLLPQPPPSPLTESPRITVSQGSTTTNVTNTKSPTTSDGFDATSQISTKPTTLNAALNVLEDAFGAATGPSVRMDELDAGKVPKRVTRTKKKSDMAATKENSSEGDTASSAPIHPIHSNVDSLTADQALTLANNITIPANHKKVTSSSAEKYVDYTFTTMLLIF
ncbi:hypothetical protein BJ165DRAFT_769855 [Panaeolus papilionaceus]|nr:hypothetical protein BJ165DRAFT_769855 [Panaeolus papilionaceus]